MCITSTSWAGRKSNKASVLAGRGFVDGYKQRAKYAVFKMVYQVIKIINLDNLIKDH